MGRCVDWGRGGAVPKSWWPVRFSVLSVEPYTLAAESAPSVGRPYQNTCCVHFACSVPATSFLARNFGSRAESTSFLIILKADANKHIYYRG